MANNSDPNDRIANIEQMNISAVQAKSAILELLRLERTLDGLDGTIERMENADVAILDADRIRFDVVTCNLKKKEFAFNIIAPPLVATYVGELRLVGGQWKAEITAVTRN